MPKRERVQPTRFKMIPLGHILRPVRLALVTSPCCGRRIRIRLDRDGEKWGVRRFQRCPKCRRLWRAESKVSRHGFLRSVILELAV